LKKEFYDKTKTKPTQEKDMTRDSDKTGHPKTTKAESPSDSKPQPLTETEAEKSEVILPTKQ